jgi:hypothetical protein
MDNAAVIKLIFILQGSMFMALIGVYVWSFNLSMKTDAKISKVYECMNTNYVKKEVFDIAYATQTDDISEIKGDVKRLIQHQIKKAG